MKLTAATLAGLQNLDADSPLDKALGELLAAWTYGNDAEMRTAANLLLLSLGQPDGEE